MTSSNQECDFYPYVIRYVLTQGHPPIDLYVVIVIYNNMFCCIE